MDRALFVATLVACVIRVMVLPAAGATELSLEECIQRALRYNTLSLEREEDRRIARERISEAYSGAFPRIDASAQYTRLEEEPMYFGRGVGKEDNYQARIGLVQPVYRGGKVWNGIQIAGLYSQFTDLLRDATWNELIYEVKRGFYTILFLQELIRIREDSIGLLEAHLEDTRKRQRAGMAPDFEVLRAEVELANARPPLIEARNRLAHAVDGFRKLLGMGLYEEVRLSGSLVPWKENGPSLEGKVGLALSLQPEVQQRERLLEIRKRVVGVERGGHLPNVTLFANYEGVSPNTKVRLEWEWEWDWKVGLKFDLPLFTGFETRSKIRQAEFEVAKAELALRDARERVELEVKAADREIREAQERILSQMKNIEKAREGIRIAEVRYRHGLAPQLEVLDARVALTAAQVNYFQAVYDQRVAVARMERATAEGLSPYRGK